LDETALREGEGGREGEWGEGEEESHSQLWREEGREGGREGGFVSGKGEVEPQVGEERVFPVSHEVIHREASYFSVFLLCLE
jgi:hypothetical protein